MRRPGRLRGRQRWCPAPGTAGPHGTKPCSALGPREQRPSGMAGPAAAWHLPAALLPGGRPERAQAGREDSAPWTVLPPDGPSSTCRWPIDITTRLPSTGGAQRNGARRLVIHPDQGQASALPLPQAATPTSLKRASAGAGAASGLRVRDLSKAPRTSAPDCRQGRPSATPHCHGRARPRA